MSNISKIIDKSVKNVISESDDTAEAIKTGVKKAAEAIKGKSKEIYNDLATGKAGQIVYDKLHPEKPDIALELGKKLGKVNRELAAERQALAAERNLGVGEHLTRAGKKAIENTKETAQEVIDKIKENPGVAAATAAALAAGVGGLAAVKKMRKAAKK